MYSPFCAYFVCVLIKRKELHKNNKINFANNNKKNNNNNNNKRKKNNFLSSPPSGFVSF